VFKEFPMEKNETKKRLIITVDESLHKDLKVQAALNSTTMNAIINKALKAYDFKNESDENPTVSKST
jgi:hypothetical protein